MALEIFMGEPLTISYDTLKYEQKFLKSLLVAVNQLKLFYLSGPSKQMPPFFTLNAQTGLFTFK